MPIGVLSAQIRFMAVRVRASRALFAFSCGKSATSAVMLVCTGARHCGRSSDGVVR